MPKYIANSDVWISHECRMAKAGDRFETEFPKGPGGADMRLGDSLTLVSDKPSDKAPPAVPRK